MISTSKKRRNVPITIPIFSVRLAFFPSTFSLLLFFSFSAASRLAGKTGQAYNTRKNRKGAFRGDRYHTTAVSTDSHLIRCLMYVDMSDPARIIPVAPEVRRRLEALKTASADDIESAEIGRRITLNRPIP